MTDHYICPKCKRPLRNAKAWHYCEEVSIDDVFLKASDEVLLAFDTLMSEVMSWDGVAMSATKNCVVFVRKKTFLVAKPMKAFLEVKFYSNELIDDPALHRSQPWSGKYQGIFRFANEREIYSGHFDYFKGSHAIS